MRSTSRGARGRFVVLKRVLATATAIAAVAAGTAIAITAPAAAHTGDIRGNAVCNTDTGTFDVTYTLSLRNVPDGLNGSSAWHFDDNLTQNWGESSFSNWEGGPKAVVGNDTVVITQSLPGTATRGPWLYIFTKFENGQTVKSDTRIDQLPGGCIKTPPPPANDWTYSPPTCEGLTVNYPDNLGEGQAKNVNIRVKNLADGEERTFNFHNNTGTYSGTKTFNVKDHPDWPGWTWFEYRWTQVAGTNYHWEGSVVCGQKPPPTDWQYSPPTCEGLTVNYPEEVAGIAQRATIKVKNLATGKTRVFRFDVPNPSASFVTFNVKEHPDWDEGWTWFTYESIELYGTTYQWTGSVVCGEEPPPTEEPPTTPPVTDPPTSPPVTPPVTEPPTETPTSTPSTTATPTPSPSKAAVIVKVNKTKAPPSASKATLAETGADDSVVRGGIIALALMALGSGTILAVRRRIAQGS